MKTTSDMESIKRLWYDVLRRAFELAPGDAREAHYREVAARWTRVTSSIASMTAFEIFAEQLSSLFNLLFGRRITVEDLTTMEALLLATWMGALWTVNICAFFDARQNQC